MCLVRSECCEKHFWQYSHWYGFSLVWLLTCLVSSERCEKLFWQYSHWYGLSLVWVLMWTFRRDCCEKHLWQYWHRCGLSSLGLIVWLWRTLLCWECINFNLLTVDVYPYFKLCAVTCCFILSKQCKYMPHLEHLQGFNNSIMLQRRLYRYTNIILEALTPGL